MFSVNFYRFFLVLFAPGWDKKYSILQEQRNCLQPFVSLLSVQQRAVQSHTSGSFGNAGSTDNSAMCHINHCPKCIHALMRSCGCWKKTLKVLNSLPPVQGVRLAMSAQHYVYTKPMCSLSIVIIYSYNSYNSCILFYFNHVCSLVDPCCQDA